MNVTVEKKELLGALKSAEAATAGKRTTLPILRNVLLTTEDANGGLRVIGTDLEKQVSSWVPAEALAYGHASIPATEARRVVNGLTNGPITIDAAGEGDEASFADADGVVTVSIRGLPACEHPELPDVGAIDYDASAGLPVRDLLAAIDRTAFAASDDETRPMLTGVLFEFSDKENRLRLVATDTHRMVVSDIDADVSPPVLPDHRVIVPAHTLKLIAKAWAKADDTNVSLRVDEKRAVFACPGQPTVTVRLIDGEFVSYDKVIPEEDDFSRVATFEPEAVATLCGSLDRLAPVSGEDADRTVWAFNGREVALSASCGGNKAEAGPVPCVMHWPSGKCGDMAIGFNGDYLGEALAVTKGAVAMATLSPTRAARLTDAEVPGWQYVCMPMQVM